MNILFVKPVYEEVPDKYNFQMVMQASERQIYRITGYVNGTKLLLIFAICFNLSLAAIISWWLIPVLYPLTWICSRRYHVAKFELQMECFMRGFVREVYLESITGVKSELLCQIFNSKRNAR
ncbi:MAG: hypothetical protein RLZ10_736 [Bacteroidota bacterium]